MKKLWKQISISKVVRILIFNIKSRVLIAVVATLITKTTIILIITKTKGIAVFLKWFITVIILILKMVIIEKWTIKIKANISLKVIGNLTFTIIITEVVNKMSEHTQRIIKKK